MLRATGTSIRAPAGALHIRQCHSYFSLAMPMSASRLRDGDGALESRLDGVLGLQLITPLSEQMPAKDRDEGCAHETGTAPAGESAAVSHEDYQPRRHHGPVEDIKCGNGTINHGAPQIITCLFLMSIANSIIRPHDRAGDYRTTHDGQHHLVVGPAVDDPLN
jgi:hypothetical protein